MSPTVRHVLRSDFGNTFSDVQNVTAVDIYNWAINTQEFYKFFFDKYFYHMAKDAIRREIFHKYDRTYKPVFMEWCAWEIIPTYIHDFIAFTVIQHLKMKIDRDEIRKSAEMIYDNYLNHFKTNYL